MNSKSSRNTSLFTLRIWAEPQEKDLVKWRGKLQLLPKGEAYYFRGWQDLIEHLGLAQV